jgi:Ca2+/Na+ antiporter
MALAAALYIAMLTTVSFSAGGGDAAMGDALASFLFTVALWIVLALLAGTAAIMGEVPRRIVVMSAVLVPLAGVTTFVAIDMCSRHIKWAIIGPILLPLLVVLYAAVARFAKLRAVFPGHGFNIAVWSAIVTLSVVLLLAAM